MKKEHIMLAVAMVIIGLGVACFYHTMYEEADHDDAPAPAPAAAVVPQQLPPSQAEIAEDFEELKEQLKARKDVALSPTDQAKADTDERCHHHLTYLLTEGAPASADMLAILYSEDNERCYLVEEQREVSEPIISGSRSSVVYTDTYRLYDADSTEEVYMLKHTAQGDANANPYGPLEAKDTASDLEDMLLKAANEHRAAMRAGGTVSPSL